MSRYYDDDGDYERGRGRRPSPPPQFRDRSPDYHYAGGASQARLQYEPQSPFYPPDSGNNLQVPQTRHRPRSLPPMSSGAIVPRGRRTRSPASSVSSEERERDRSPLAKARHVLKDTFSQSNSGLGVGVLGAIVGGIAAREASEATIRARGKSSHSGDHDKSRLVSTIIGAAVGGLGANALEKRLETAKRKDEETREEVDRRPHGPVRGANADYYDNDDYDYVYDRKPRHRRSEDRY